MTICNPYVFKLVTDRVYCINTSLKYYNLIQHNSVIIYVSVKFITNR